MSLERHGLIPGLNIQFDAHGPKGGAPTPPVEQPKPPPTEPAQDNLGERDGASHGTTNTFDEPGERPDDVKIPGVDY